MTAQELFDIVFKHLMSQSAKSMMVVEGGFSCAYRGKDGLKCGIGILIPDEDYREDMEGFAVQNLLAKGACLCHLAAHRELLYKLQGIHDEDPVEDWGRALRETAVAFGLVCP